MTVDGSAAAEPESARIPSATEVFRQEFRYVWNTLRRLGVQERDLEDVTHEVFIRVHAQLPLFDAERPLRAWLFSLALGVAANYRRLARHRTSLAPTLPEVADPNGAAEENLLRREESRQVHEALQDVPLEQRAILVLHELDGYSIPEVAVTLGLGLNTAYSRLRLGREAFRQAFRRKVTAKGKR